MRLIDADELKNVISEEVTRKFVRWDKTITVAEWETFIQDIIDNAPTVETPEGVWIDEMDVYCKCPFCGFKDIKYSKYCPDCGARLLDETEYRQKWGILS